MKKINITTALLLVYLIVVATIGWIRKGADFSPSQYFLVLGATLAVILLLRFIQVQRLKLREKRKKDEDSS